MTTAEEPRQPLRRPADYPPITDVDGLRQRWRSLVGTERFGRRSLWLIFLDAEGIQLPIVMPIDDVPARPDRTMLAGLGEILGQVRIADRHVASVAMLLSRPGDDAATAADWTWARELGRVLSRAGMPTWPLHLATNDQVQRITLDQPGTWAETG